MTIAGAVKLASEEMKAGNYHRAIELYSSAGAEIGISNFRWNIEYCQKRILSGSGNQVSLPFGSWLRSVFDRVYVVSLKAAVHRRLKVFLQLNRYGMEFELFEAVNGYQGDPYDCYLNYTRRPLGELNRYPEFRGLEVGRGKPFIESAGAVGYIYTYLNILRDAKDKKYGRILILEDDVILHNDFPAKIRRFIAAVGKSWKILQLGASQYRWESVIETEATNRGYYLPRRLHTCGSFAIGIDCSVMDELHDAASAFESPFDHLALGEIYEKYLGECFVCYPNIVMPDVANSSIRGGRSQQAHSEKMRWRMADYIYPLPRPAIAILVTSENNLRYLDSFSDPSDRAFDLRLYFNSEDGLRPVHDRRVFEKPHYEIAPVTSKLNLPSSDFFAVLDEDYVLTEADVVNYMQSLLKGTENRTDIQTLKATSQPVVAGKVSVIIPTYKRPKNLRSAIESVIMQDYENKEIVVVSDNTADSEHADETRSIIQEVRRTNPGAVIRYVQHKYNRNGAAARNSGIQRSDGEFICFLDDDDIYLPGRIGLAVAALQGSRATVGAVYCGFLGWNSPVNDLNRYKQGDLSRELLMLEYKKHYLHTNTATYRRSALVAINGFDETYRRHQDIELNLRFFERYEVAAVKEVGVRLNPVPSDVSNKIFNADILNLKQKFLERFRHVIESFDSKTQKTIYELHWAEVARYTTDKASLVAHIGGRLAEGSAQVLLKI